MKSSWFVYMLQTAGGLLYTGISTDPERRLAEHTGTGTGKGKGAKSLRGKGPLKLVFQMTARDRSEASKLEARIKKLSRSDKDKLVEGDKGILGKVMEKGKQENKEKGENLR